MPPDPRDSRDPCPDVILPAGSNGYKLQEMSLNGFSRWCCRCSENEQPVALCRLAIKVQNLLIYTVEFACLQKVNSKAWMTASVAVLMLHASNNFLSLQQKQLSRQSLPSKPLNRQIYEHRRFW